MIGYTYNIDERLWYFHYTTTDGKKYTSVSLAPGLPEQEIFEKIFNWFNNYILRLERETPDKSLRTASN